MTQFRFTHSELSIRGIVGRFGLPELFGWIAATALFYAVLHLEWFGGTVPSAAIWSDAAETAAYLLTSFALEFRLLNRLPEFRQRARRHRWKQALMAALGTLDVIIANVIDACWGRPFLTDHFGALQSARHYLDGDSFSGMLSGKVLADLAFYGMILVISVAFWTFNRIQDRVAVAES